MQDRLERIVREFSADTGTLHLLEDGVLVLKGQVGLPPHVQEIVRRVPVGKGMTICAPAPLQTAGCTALALPDSYYEEQRARYARRRDILLPALERAGFAFTPPEGSYYVM